MHSGLESPNSQRQPRGGGGDGVPAAASPEALGDPPNSGGRAGTRTRPQFPVSVGYFRPRIWWAGAGNWLEAVEAVVGARFPLPLSTSPLTLRGRGGARGGLRGEFRCLTAVSDPTSLGSDVLLGAPGCLSGSQCLEERERLPTPFCLRDTLTVPLDPFLKR